MRHFTFLMVMVFSFITVFAQEGAGANSGIFYNGEKVGSSRIIGQRLGNLAGAYFTMGLSGAKRALQIEGKSSDLTIDEKRPAFTVVFSDHAVPAVLTYIELDG